MKPEHQDIITDQDEFNELCTLVYLNSLYRLQDVWLKKNIAIDLLLANPVKLDTTPYFMVAEYDRMQPGDYPNPPITKVHISVNVPRMVLDYPHPLPDVLVWFAEVCELYAATTEKALYEKALYRLLRTHEALPVVVAAYHRDYIDPLLALPCLKVVFSNTEIVCYLPTSNADTQAQMQALGFQQTVFTTLAALRLHDGSTTEYDAFGVCISYSRRDDPDFDHLVEIELKKRKLNLLIAD